MSVQKTRTLLATQCSSGGMELPPRVRVGVWARLVLTPVRRILTVWLSGRPLAVGKASQSPPLATIQFSVLGPPTSPTLW